MTQRRLAQCLLVLSVLLVVALAQKTEPEVERTPTQNLREATPEAITLDPGAATVDAFAKFEQHETIGMVLAGVVVFIAAGGGTGGGGVLNPVYIFLMQLDTKVAIPLSSITIVGGAIANFLLNIRKSRRNSNEPLIDWDLVLVMQPMLLLGANFGTFLNSILPSWLLCVLLVILLIFTGKKTLEKAIQARRREHWGCCGDQDRTPLLIGANSRYNAQQQQQHQTFRNAVIPWRKVGYLFGLFGGVVLLSLIVGTPKFPSIIGLSPHSWIYPILAFLPVIFLMVFSHYASKNIIETFYRQQNPRYILSADEIQWTPRSAQLFPLIAMGAGTVSGMFGLGGGMINAPLLLELGVEPAAASAITATTVLFSSSMSSVSYVLLGSLNFHYAQFLLPIGFLATYLGHVCLEHAIKRFNCPSLIIFSMAAIVLVSAVAMSVESIRTLLA
ncbi:hypothetical protein Poli38472_006075 [Pythium oligandrum]|uniref:Membrane transporter protein n=1 Tax=Pythium oligandrum TaxID=41045 RepID=A0A8K1CTQ4_PYTOL|nr:hypothetical protein Poli38472_006075 [Pythium oligandrum]|eukprot:TMW68607.1 hypothetical protein Poli38472_006075 [Pythium oligandrum]